MIALDASAVLCFLQGEPGAPEVGEAMHDGAVVSTANWSEVAQKMLASRRQWTTARQLLISLHISVEPVTIADAEAAAQLWLTRPALSLADRLCLATATRLGCSVVLTADRQWGEVPPIRQLR